MIVPAQAQTFKTGSFVKTSGTATVDQVIAHGLGEAPKALILWTNAKSNESFSAELALSYGFTDGTTSYSVGTASQNGVATSNAARRMGTKLLTIIPPTSGSGPLVEAAFKSWDATNFTVTWSPNTATSYVIHYIVIGGSGVSAKVINWQLPTATGAKVVTGIGFQPDVVLHAIAGGGFTGALDTSAAKASFGLGVMNSAGAQWANSVLSVDNVANGDTTRGQKTDACIAAIDNLLTYVKNASFTSMDADGFTLNYTTANTDATQVMSLALRGVNAHAGSFSKSTNTGVPVSQPVTGSTFAPSVVLLSSVQDVAQAGTPTVQNRVGIGAASATAEGSSAVADLDAAATMSTQGIDKTSKAFMKVNNATSTIDAEADLASMDTDGFTLSWTTNDAVATEILYLAFGVVPRAILSSAANQSFTIGQAATTASVQTVTEAATATITTANEIRIRIPAAFNMTWDTSVTTITRGGAASTKVSATLAAYEDSNHTAVVNVTTNFAASDVLTITGLAFKNFTATSAADNLELVTGGAGGTTTDEDDKTITVIALVVGGFNAYETTTGAGAITGVIKTKIAGASVSVDMIALNLAKNAIETTFTGTVRVEVLNASNNSAGLDGNGCRSSWTVIQTLSDPIFIGGDNGRKTISFTEANSYPDARLKIYYPVTSPLALGCSGDNFAIRPNTLASFAVTDTDWQTTGAPGARALNLLTFAATTPIHKAGRAFSVRATALNAAGSPATTTNYTGAPSATLSTCGSAACTASFGTLTLTTTFAAGLLASDVASYSNVGAFSLQLQDTAFASVDAADTTGDCTGSGRYVCSASLDVGRFVPDHFAVALTTSPVFGPACGSFSYIGQVFNYTTAPVITVTAQNFANATTTLYNTIGSWFRIADSTLTGKAYTATPASLDASGVTGTDPVIAASGAGVGTLTFGSGSGLLFTRSTPPAPFNAEISLAINVTDLDGVAYASNPVTVGATSPGNGIAFTSNYKQMRFGRLRLGNAFGSSLLDLPLPLTAQYYDGSNFLTNTLDSCTSLAASTIRMAAVATPDLVATCLTSLSPTGTIAFSSGQASSLKLTKLSSGNRGMVDLTVNLNGASGGNTCTPTLTAVTSAGKSWLQGDWGSGAYSDDPRGRATFGIYKNADPILYLRERY